MGEGGDGVGYPGAMVPPPMAPGAPGPPMGGAGAPATRPGPGQQRAYPHVPMPQQQYQPPMGQAAPQMMPGMMQQPVGGGAVGVGVVGRSPPPKTLHELRKDIGKYQKAKDNMTNITKLSEMHHQYPWL